MKDSRLDLTVLSDEEFWALEALLAKAEVREAMGDAGGRQPYKPELLEPKTLARIANGSAEHEPIRWENSSNPQRTRNLEQSAMVGNYYEKLT